MSVIIKSVEAHGPAHRAGIKPGEKLLSINGNEVIDILDYRFYETDRHLSLELMSCTGERRTVTIKKREYQPIGLDFETYLMDKQRSCCNKCVFCFVDQLPKGMRETLYFKDDDERLSFLFGNYITLTNLSERELDRIIRMHISPVNVSVHTTNPELRVRMMKNPNAALIMERLRLLAAGGVKLNCQLVLCPGYNDGAELERSVRELMELAPQVQSIALVPVGLTDHRENLPPLRLFTSQEAAEIIALAEKYAHMAQERFGTSIVWAADELYINAGLPFPPAERYEDYPQLENGVGLISLLQKEFISAMAAEEGDDSPRRATIATGLSAAPTIETLVKQAQEKWPAAQWQVVPIVNNFFGKNITVAGLVTGGDLIAQLKEKGFGGGRLLIPSCMLRHEGDLFLDGVSTEDVEQALGAQLVTVDNSGYELLDALLAL